VGKESTRPRRPLDIDKTALFLIRRFGDDCAIVAFQRSRCCANNGEPAAAAQWRQVMCRVVELHFARPQGKPH
jgi:hypothetical protein